MVTQKELALAKKTSERENLAFWMAILIFWAVALVSTGVLVLFVYRLFTGQPIEALVLAVIISAVLAFASARVVSEREGALLASLRAERELAECCVSECHKKQQESKERLRRSEGRTREILTIQEKLERGISLEEMEALGRRLDVIRQEREQDEREGEESDRMLHE